MAVGGVEVRRGGDRPLVGDPQVRTRPSLAYGTYYDPAQTHFGLLVAHNEHELQPGHGFDRHAHRDLEIVTWVIAGQLAHEDSGGGSAVVRPGTVQLLSAGGGVQHSELAASGAVTRVLQAWLVPDTDGGQPAYTRLDVDAALAAGGLVPVVSGQGHGGALPLRQRAAVLWAGRLREPAPLPAAAYVHVYVAAGHLGLDTTSGDELLAAGDAARLVRAPGRLVPQGAAEVLVWAMDAQA